MTQTTTVRAAALTKETTPYTRYEALTRDYRARYGDKTVVVFRIGNFDTVMSVRDGLVDIDRIADVAGVRATQLNKRDPVASPTNYALCGWPISQTRTHIERLLAANYRVVVVKVEYHRDMDREVITADTFFPRPRSDNTADPLSLLDGARWNAGFSRPRPFSMGNAHTCYDALTRDYRERY